MPNSEPIELTGDGVTVHKSFRESVYPSPSIVIVIERWVDTPRTVTITESLPADTDATVVEFDADSADDWTARTDELVYTKTISEADHIEIAYSYAGGFDDRESWLSPPQVTVTSDAGDTVLSVDDPGPKATSEGGGPPTITAVTDGGGQSDSVTESEATESDDLDGDAETNDPGGDAETIDLDGDAETIDLDGDAEDSNSDGDDRQLPLTEENIHDYGSGFADISVSPRWSVGLAHEPDEPEAVESGDVYGQEDANPSSDAVDEDPESLYGEVEPRWSSEDRNTVSSYGEQDAYEPDDDNEGDYGYGDSGIVENDDAE